MKNIGVDLLTNIIDFKWGPIATRVAGFYSKPVSDWRDSDHLLANRDAGFPRSDSNWRDSDQITSQPIRALN